MFDVLANNGLIMDNVEDLQPLSLDIFNGSAIEAAREVIGSILLFGETGGIIVEAEAYEQTDPASHSFRGQRPGNRSMFGPPAHTYVYRSYGVHWCLNFVCGPPGHGAAVLIRAIEPLMTPLANVVEMKSRRGTENIRLLCAGPGRLTQALGINHQHDGMFLGAAPFQLLRPILAPPVIAGPRIGITKAIDRPWRFGLAGSGFLSRPFPRK